jgi:hypothetical protein
VLKRHYPSAPLPIIHAVVVTIRIPSEKPSSHIDGVQHLSTTSTTTSTTSTTYTTSTAAALALA